MKTLTTAVLLSALVGASIGVITPAVASQHGKQGMGMGMGMMHHEGMSTMHYGGGWKASLTEQQQNQVAKLKLDYKKQAYPIKAKLKEAKVSLALLMVADKPSQKNINSKIDQIIKLKSQKIRLKVNHKIAVRKVLNAEQRVKFDMKVLKKAYHGKKQGHAGPHHR